MTQSIAFAGRITPESYNGNTKSVYERAYAMSIDVWDNATSAYLHGASVASAATARRVATAVFTTTIPPSTGGATLVTSAETKADSSSLATNFVSNFAAAKVAFSASGVTTPTSSQMTVQPVPGHMYRMSEGSFSHFFLVLFYQELAARRHHRILHLHGMAKTTHSYGSASVVGDKTL